MLFAGNFSCGGVNRYACPVPDPKDSLSDGLFEIE
jgi:hypothetical protein